MLAILLAVATAPFDYAGTLKPGQRLEVRDVNGDVRVRNGDRFSVHANRHARRGDAAAVTVRVDTNADGAIVCVRYPGERESGSCNGNGGGHNSDDNDTVVDLEIVVPRGVRLDVATVNGSIDAQVDAEAKAADINGAILLDAAQISSARTVNGQMTLRVRAQRGGTISARSVNGSIALDLPTGAGLTLAARTVTGDIDVAGVAVERPRYGPGAHASATLGDGAIRVNATTVNGSITIRR